MNSVGTAQFAQIVRAGEIRLQVLRGQVYVLLRRRSRKHDGVLHLNDTGRREPVFQLQLSALLGGSEIQVQHGCFQIAHRTGPIRVHSDVPGGYQQARLIGSRIQVRLHVIRLQVDLHRLRFGQSRVLCLRRQSPRCAEAEASAVILSAVTDMCVGPSL